jgi:hypothetical protein
MLDASEYRTQAESNEAAAHDVRRNYPDWAVTMCFYSALHWVNYHAANGGIDIDKNSQYPTPHDKRSDYVREIASKIKSRDLRKAYDALFEASMRSRYMRDIRESAISHYQFADSSVKSAFEHLSVIRDTLGGN